MSEQTVLCFGDSNTWGYDPVGARRFARDVRWPGVLQAELGAGVTIIEEGLCGRTTVWEDPLEQHKNGAAQLPPILLSHVPLDLVVLMLGTNDLKSRFSVSALEVARGAGNVVSLARSCQTAYSGPAPEVLLVCPPPFASLAQSPFAPIFVGAEEKSRELAPHFRQVAEESGCHFLDAGEIIQSSPADGIHFEAEEHHKLGRAVAAEGRRILSA